MTMTNTSWNNAKGKVTSWMENELHCVTAQRISQSLNMSREEASRLLQDILTDQQKSNNNHALQITSCHTIQEQTGEHHSTTVFRLQSSTTAPSPSLEDDDNHVTIFALASKEATESVATAHERDMIQWREMVSSVSKDHVATTEIGSFFSSSIAPADQVLQQQQQQDPHQTKKVIVAETKSSQPFQSGNRHVFQQKAKPVTAASFFAHHKNKEASTMSGNNAKPTVASSKKPSPQPTEEKENEPRKNKNKTQHSKVGNADDFVADEEQSEDDAEEVVTQQRAPTKQQRGRKQARSPSPERDVSKKRSTAAAPSVVVGAMDAFTTTKDAVDDDVVEVVENNNDNNKTKKQRKRRKKLVEKTAMVNGYLRTETQVVWEDIPTDEEAEEEIKMQEMTRKRAAPIKSKPAAAAQGMKQKSLMGFFAKKK